MARPIKLTPEVQQKIVEAIKMGNYIETAAAYAGISKNTLYDWMKRGAREKDRIAGTNRKPKATEAPFVAFSDAIEKAMADAEVRDVLIIANAAKENWQAAAWRLERKYPDRWGRKDKVHAEVKQDVNVTNTNRQEIFVRIEEVLKNPDEKEQMRDVIRSALRQP
ncbi:hypothetical protein [Cohnella massiliensis]|uniref:hypothetical protein n=1 Tax=Cohnella massiliensis TaxID=1816691 RepID=UPI0009BC4830|nr:hypothetical protein [Cohnella massiliensis]